MKVNESYELALEIAKTISVRCQTKKETEQLIELVEKLSKHKWTMSEQLS